MVGSPEEAGVGTDDDIGFGDGYGTAVKFQVGTVVLGSVLGFGNCNGDGIDDAGSPVRSGGDTDAGSRLFGARGIAGRFGAGTVVVGCLFGFGDGIV